jgi:hypothetical protein
MQVAIFLAAAGALAINPALTGKLPCDPLEDSRSTA